MALVDIIYNEASFNKLRRFAEEEFHHQHRGEDDIADPNIRNNNVLSRVFISHVLNRMVTLISCRLCVTIKIN